MLPSYTFRVQEPVRSRFFQDPRAHHCHLVPEPRKSLGEGDKRDFRSSVDPMKTRKRDQNSHATAVPIVKARPTN
jgi:hypothetical protein